MSDAERGAAQRGVLAQIERDCTQTSGLRCDVITFYSGSVFHLYRYKKYTDVRLVFAPEFDMAFFGGDPDNFTYPRYDLDITFFRIYENDKPVQLKDYLKWSRAGVQDNELVFVSGNPGATGRLLTMAQLEFLRDVQFPWQLKSYRRRDDTLKQFAAESPAKNLEAHDDIFGIENSFKAVTGYLSGLKDEKFLAKKRAEEQQLQQTVNSDAKMKAEFGNPWSEIERTIRADKQI